MKKFLKGLWKAIVAIAKAVWAFAVAVVEKILDLITDEKGQLDERRILGIACYVVGLWLAISIPSLVIKVRDLASAGAMAAVITVLFGAGATLLNIARKADARILDSLPPFEDAAEKVGEDVAAAASGSPAKDGA